MKQSTRDEAKGRVHEVKGKIKEKVGKLTNNPDLEGQGIGEQLYHQNLPYQRKNWLPTKSASRAMLPRKTPKGIW